MGTQIPVIPEKSLTTCGSRKFQLDPLGDHLNTCITHSGAKKAHDWMVDQIVDLFHTTHEVKTQQVVKNRGQDCGDVGTDPSLNGHLKYPNNLDQSLNDAATDKIRKYRVGYNRSPCAVSFIPASSISPQC